MPRGIPKNKAINNSEINMTKELDNKTNLEILGAISAEKIDEPASVLAPSQNDLEYTVSPDGKYRIQKPKKHADFLDKTPSRIPYITDPDVLGSYHIIWETDEKPHTLNDRGKQGFEFVDTNTIGCEHAVPTHSGYRPDGSAYLSYAMWMSLSKFKEIEKMRQTAITEKEQQILKHPSDESNSIYATSDMKMGHFIRKNS